MRHLLILLALFLGVAATTPYFWAVLGMNFGSAKIGAERPDGTMEWSIMGPSAPWPDWVPEVSDATLTIASYVEPSDGYPASGMGYLKPLQDVAVLQRQIAANLDREGWAVATWAQSTSDAGLPPRPIRLCTITASKGDRSFWIALYEGDETQSRIVWQQGGTAYSAPAGAQAGLC